MSSVPTPKPPPEPKPPQKIWFFDTCTLMNLQVSADLDALVQQQMGGEICVLMGAVVDELDRLADESPDPKAADLARRALANIAWLGAAHADDDWVEDPEDVVYWQDQIADGRPLKHEQEHWAESVIISIIERLSEDYDVAVFMSDEYSARVHATRDHNWCEAYSLLRYLHTLVHDGTLPAADAFAIGEELHTAGRGPSVLLSDFANSDVRGLGRHGQP